MRKKIILMAKSRKGGGHYCVAGIDANSGEWVRVVSSDASTQHAVTEEDMKYENGAIPEVLDIINIRCKAYTPMEYQPENYTMNSSYYWEKTGEADIDRVLSLHPAECHQELFYDTDQRISPDDIDEIDEDERYSLALIQPTNVVIHVTQFDESAAVKVKTSFRYMGNDYQYITITDPVFEARYIAKGLGRYRIYNVYFVVSLGDPNPRDGLHYKLVATVLEGD